MSRSSEYDQTDPLGYRIAAGSNDEARYGSTNSWARRLPPWRARAETWRAAEPISWGPSVLDARRLWSRDVLEVVASHVGVGVGDVADRVLMLAKPHRYLLLGTIARTRRCMVVGAVDQLLARSVALKVPHEHDDVATWRLLAEVQAMTRAEHPHVVAVHDAGEHEGSMYAALELCDGDLDGWCAGKPWELVIDRIIEAGRGLEAVHACGLVHGDIKPGNVFLKGGVAKLGDFGMAARPGWTARIGGTPGYIAPEIADGQQGPAGDVFALACTAWKCLTGWLPFGDPPASADASAATLVLIERAREGQLHAEATEVPEAVLAALRCALQPEPERRPRLPALLAQLAALRSTGALGRWLLSTNARARAWRKTTT